MLMPSMIEPPSGRLPEKAPRWDLMGTESCGGGKVFLWTPLMVWEYFRIYRAEREVGGLPRGPQARGPPPRARPEGVWSPWDSSGPLSKLCGCLLVQQKSSQKFYSVGIINLVPLVVSHSAGLPLVSENTCSCPNHFAPLMLLPFDRLTVSLKTS